MVDFCRPGHIYIVPLKNPAIQCVGVGIKVSGRLMLLYVRLFWGVNYRDLIVRETSILKFLPYQYTFHRKDTSESRTTKIHFKFPSMEYLITSNF